LQAPTVEQLARVLGKEVAAESWSSLVALQPNGSKPPFFWIHGEASDAVLPRYLGSEQALYGLMHQGLDGKALRYTSVEEIAAHYLSEIGSVQPDGPYFLGGYCFGGLVALEIAQQLRKRNKAVALLIILEPIDLRQCKPFGKDFDVPAGLRDSVEFSQRKTVRSEATRHLSELRRLTVKQKFFYIQQRIIVKLKNGVTIATKPLTDLGKKAVIQVYLRYGYPLPHGLRSKYILDVYSNAIRNYRPRTYPSPIVILNAVGNTSVPRYWRRLASGGFDVHAIPGDHTTVLKEPHISAWIEHLKACLDRAQTAVSKASCFFSAFTFVACQT
jgi:thioesterase domain-containing protein